jgi:putative acetyltransferase
MTPLECDSLSRLGMKFLVNPKARERELASLFTLTFADSEGSAEGKLIGGLVKSLLSDTAPDDLYMIAAEKDGTLLAACAFSRLLYGNDERIVFLLAPVAVAPEHQGRGYGQKLISYGLSVLRQAGVDMAMTYGDPNFYSKVGFHFVREEDAPAPFPLQQPEGWLGFSLTTKPWTPLKGPSTCVRALNQPVFW